MFEIGGLYMGINIFANSIIELFLEFLSDKSISDSAVSSERWQFLHDKLMSLAGRFTSGTDTEVAELIIDNFEEILVDADVEIPNDERDTEDAALIFGDDYYSLEDSIMYYANQFLF